MPGAFLGVLREPGAGGWTAYEAPVGYVITSIDVTIVQAAAGGTLAITPGRLTQVPDAPDFAAGNPSQVECVWALPAGGALPASGLRFQLRDLEALSYRSIGIGGAGAPMVASIAVELERVC